ncbi:hypothetical protein [Pseudophaeobacter flagellatus]|uniref:hypothetical protein n=1 Tax=Pseudophaeobacter flagellatus TaxID=2899119 RepID=UPI001E3028E5|nr:hypothetical protein [Pseudophaeobacter flagellatus]MCD9149273.1 hypothetical protein [Pseudophaeobacter flagellatus]
MRAVLMIIVAVVSASDASAQELQQSAKVPTIAADASNFNEDKNALRTLDDLVRATGVDVSMLSKKLREDSAGNLSGMGFSQLFCTTHNRFETRFSKPSFSEQFFTEAIDPLE